MSNELFGPRKCVDELLDTLSATNYHCSQPQTAENCSTISRIIDLLTRYAIQSCDKKTAEKVWLHLQTMVSQLDMSVVLSQQFHPSSLATISQFSNSQPLKEMCGLGLDRPSFRRANHPDTSLSHPTQPTRPWPPDQIHNFHALYFGPFPQECSLLDVTVTLLKALAILAISFNHFCLLTTILNLGCGEGCPVELDSTVDFQLPLTNWLQIAYFCELIGLEICKNEDSKNEDNTSVDWTVCQSLCLQSLQHVDKLLALQVVLNQLQVDMEEGAGLLELSAELMDRIDRHLIYSVQLLKFSCSLCPSLAPQFSEQLHQLSSNYVQVCEPSTSIAFLHQLGGLIQSKRMCPLVCPNHICFCLFTELCGNVRRDRDTWKSLLQVYTTLPPLFCGCVKAQEVLNSLMFVTDQVLLPDFIVALKHHFGGSLARRKIDTSLISNYYYNEIFSAWTTISSSISAQTVANQLLQVFELIAPWLSLEDYTDFGQKLLVLLQRVKSFAPSNDIIAINIGDKAIRVFAHTLRGSSLLVNALIERVVLQQADQVIYYDCCYRQKAFFLFIQALLLQADFNQFHSLMTVLLEKYQQILKMGETDVWVLVADSAENFRSALQAFFDLFRYIVKNSEYFQEKFQQYLPKILSDSSKLLCICVDFLQGCSEVTKNVRVMAQLVSSLVIVQLDSNSIKLKQLCQTFDKLRETASTTVNLFLLKTLLCEYSSGLFNQPLVSEEEKEESSMAKANEDSCDIYQPLASAIVPPTVHMVSLLAFLLDQLTQLVEEIRVLEPDCEHRLQALVSGVKPMDMHGTPCKQSQVIFSIFRVVELLQKRWAQSSTIEQWMKIAGAFVLANPKAQFLAAFFPLCYTGSHITKNVIQVLRGILEKTHFEPGEVLLFPQPECEEQLEQHSLHINSNGAASITVETTNKVTLCSGLTVSSWVKLVSNQCSSWQHIFTIGSRKQPDLVADWLVMSADIQPRTGLIRVRVLSKQLCVFEKLFVSVVRLGGAWVNLMMGLRYGKGELGVVVMVGNHNVVFNKTVDLKLPLEEVPLLVSVGSRAAESREPIYLMSTFFAFKGILRPIYGTMLRSIGSACFSLTDCRISQIYCSFLNCLSRPTVCSKNLDARKVCTEQGKFLTTLQRSVLFTLRPSSAHCFALNILQKGLDVNSLTDMSDSALCLTMSKDYPVHWHTTIAQHRTETVDKSLRTIGGVKIFIFLYALSVDREFSSATQLEALSLLLSCLKRDPSYHQEFSQQDGTAILVHILSCRTAHMDLAICKEILSFIFSKLESTEQGELVASPRTTLVEPCLLNALVGSAELWTASRFQFWKRLVELLADCVSAPSLPAKLRDFSNKQLVHTQFLHQLLHTLLDMFQNKHMYLGTSPKPHSNSEDGNTQINIAEVLNTLVGEVVGMPFRITEVTQLWNFILLSHPPHDTYLDYSIESHNGWIKAETLYPGEEPQLDGKHSELSDFLQELLRDHGKDKISRLWIKSNSSAIAVRQQLVGEVAKRNCSKKGMVDLAEGSFRFARMNSVDNRGSLKPDFPETDARHRLPSDIPLQEHWLVQVRAKLLSLMSEIVVNCSDSLMSVVELDVIYWQTVLVLLSNQKYSKIRTLTFVLLKNFFLRCNPANRLSFVNKHGFFLLSNELKKSSVNNQIADALFSMACGEHVVLRDGLDSAHLEKIVYDPFKISCFYSLYSLLEESVGDVSLFWSVCSTLQKMFTAENAPRRSMLEIGLVDTMVNVLRKLCFSTTGPPVDSPVFSLLDCWVSFAQSIIIFLVPYRDATNYSVCEDFLWLCIIAVWQHKQEEPGGDDVHSGLSQPTILHSKAAGQGMRKALCQLIYCWIDCIQSTLSDQMRPTGLYAVNEMYSPTDDFEVVQLPTETWSPRQSSYGLPETPGDRSTDRFNPTKEFAPLEEIARRLLFGLSMAKNFFLYLQVPFKCTDEEETLFRFYIKTVLSTLKRKQTNDKSNDEWYSVLTICREKSRILLAELIAFVLFPAQAKSEIKRTANQSLTSSLPWVLKRRLITVRYLAKEIFQSRSQIINLLEVDLDYQYAMKIALHELALLPNIVDEYHLREYDGELERLIRFLRTIQIKSPLADLTKDEIASLASDEVLLVHSYYQNKCQFCNQLLAKAGLICDKENTLIKFTSDKAMTLTCEIAEYQNIPRRAFIQWRKTLTNQLAKAGNCLANLVREFCHPQAVFFDLSSWPVGHSLDTTENLCRERRRLRPDHYQFPLKFLKKEKRAAVEMASSLISPLENLLQDFKNHKTLDHVEAISQVRLSISATLLRTAFECFGEIVVSDLKLYFLGEHAKSTQKGFIHAPVTYSWSFEQVREIHSRFCQLKDTALELFTTTGDAFLLVFSTTEQRNVLLDQLNSMGLSQLIVDHKAQLQTATQMWRRDVITNFEYLMVLNKLAGRSFNDLMQYPVFPFILSDYSSAFINLTAPTSYRDLSKPMAIQDPKMEPTYIHNYNYSSEEFRRQTGTGFSSPVRFGAYHYGSHYSNTGIVAHYLVRVSPYTNVALEYQDNSFDIPDRLFNCLETSWRLSSSESTTDFKELVPEFFFFPELFQNLEGLELGVRQNGRPVDDVLLPTWCPSNNARLFCLIHRQALESSLVTANLHNWIDLIFGFKQGGEQAVKAVNLFHPATYRGRDLEGESGSDELSISAIRTMVRTYGQMPLQLFASPHLPHLNASSPLSSSAARPSAAPSLLRSVHGLRWGDFVGSPETIDKFFSSPNTVFRLDKTEKINHLSSLYKDGLEICYGIPNSAKLIVDYKSDRKDVLRRNFELTVSAMLSWSFSDNVLRIRSLDVPNSSWINLIDMQSLELAQVSFSPSNDLLYVGFKCGLVRVYSLVFTPSLRKWSIGLRSELLAHKCTITSLEVSDEFHILLSTSIDAKICVWDSNRLEFVCVLSPPAASSQAEETVTLSCISRTNSDICVVLQSGFSSRVALFSVNGWVVGVYEEKLTVTSICMTNLPEGTAINSLAIALQSGAIKLLEMWTMTAIRTISFPKCHDPIISIHFTNDSRRLYAAFAGGMVMCWQVPSLSSGGSRYKPVFRMLSP